MCVCVCVCECVCVCQKKEAEDTLQKTITDAVFADDIAFLANTPCYIV